MFVWHLLGLFVAAFQCPFVLVRVSWKGEAIARAGVLSILCLSVLYGRSYQFCTGAIGANGQRKLRHQHICVRLSQFAAIFPMFCLVTCFSMMLLCFPFGCSGGLASHSLQSSVPHHRPQVEMRRRENLARSVAFRGPRFVARCGRMSDVKLLVENFVGPILKLLIFQR